METIAKQYMLFAGPWTGGKRGNSFIGPEAAGDPGKWQTILKEKMRNKWM